MNMALINRIDNLERELEEIAKEQRRLMLRRMRVERQLQLLRGGNTKVYTLTQEELDETLGEF